MSRRPETVLVGRRTQVETPRKTLPPPSVSEEEGESEGSEDESVITANESVFTNQVYCCYSIISADSKYHVLLLVIFCY